MFSLTAQHMFSKWLQRGGINHSECEQLQEKHRVDKTIHREKLTEKAAHRWLRGFLKRSLELLLVID